MKPRIFIALLFLIIQNHYFGWNFTPKSDAEIVCDGIGFLLLSLSYRDKS